MSIDTILANNPNNPEADYTQPNPVGSKISDAEKEWYNNFQKAFSLDSLSAKIYHLKLMTHKEKLGKANGNMDKVISELFPNLSQEYHPNMVLIAKEISQGTEYPDLSQLSYTE